MTTIFCGSNKSVTCVTFGYTDLIFVYSTSAPLYPLYPLYPPLVASMPLPAGLFLFWIQLLMIYDKWWLQEISFKKWLTKRLLHLQVWVHVMDQVECRKGSPATKNFLRYWRRGFFNPAAAQVGQCLFAILLTWQFLWDMLPFTRDSGGPGVSFIGFNFPFFLLWSNLMLWSPIPLGPDHGLAIFHPCPRSWLTPRRPKS